jgi:uncharacterized membrane protein
VKQKLIDILVYIAELLIPSIPSLALLFLTRRNREIFKMHPGPTIIGFTITVIICVIDIMGYISAIVIRILRALAFLFPVLLAYYAYSDTLYKNYEVYKKCLLPRDFKIVFQKLLIDEVIPKNLEVSIRKNVFRYIQELDTPGLVKKELAALFKG